jgi:hypothetical protein
MLSIVLTASMLVPAGQVDALPPGPAGNRPAGLGGRGQLSVLLIAGNGTQTA